VALKIYARHGGAAAAAQDDITDRVPFLDGTEGTPIVQMGMSVQNGGASQGTMLVPDPTANNDNSLYFPPHTQITMTEDATGDELMLAQGRLSGFEIGRAPGSEVDHEVEWSLTVDDANVDLRGLAFTEDWVRPVETGLARLASLAAYTLNGTSSTRPDFDSKITYRPSTTIVVSSSHLAPATNAVMFPAKTYPAGTQPQDVCNDVATTEGKVYGVVPHHDSGATHLCLLFVKESDHSTYSSAAKISDQLADWNPDDLTTPVWEPIWDQGKGQRVDGNANISGLVSRYGSDNKVVISVDDTLGDDNEYWVDAYQDGDSKDPTQAANRAASIIAYRAPFSENDVCSIEILPEQHVLITAGMSIQVKAAPIAAGTDSTLGTYVDRRIVSLQWEPRANGKLHAILQLNRPTRIGGAGKAQPASTSPSPAPLCGDTTPALIGLGVDGAGWTKRNDNDYPVPGPALPTFQAVNVAASGEHALITHINYGNFNLGAGPPAGFHDWYTGGYVTKDSYAPTEPEEMLFRFTINVMGDGTTVQEVAARFITDDNGGCGAYVYMPNSGAFVPHDGLVEAIGSGSPVPFTLTQGVSYYLRWKLGDVTLWEVGDPEPGSPTATGGTNSGTGGLALGLGAAVDVPSQVEFEEVTIFSVIADDFCLDDPGSSPYYAKSDDPRFDTIVTDHGGLSGLLDDDHTQYIKDAEFTAKGDLLVGSGVGTFDNLLVGTNGKVLMADSTQTLGVKWDTVSGGSGPFEDVDTFAWRFISPAEQINSSDDTSYLNLDTNAVQLWAYAGNNIIIQDGKVYVSSDFGMVLPVLSSDPAGGDSEDGQTYYNSTTDRVRVYRNGSWTQTRKLFASAAEANLDSATFANVGASPDLTRVVAYADGSTQGAFWSFVVPDDWDSGVITLQPVWSPGSTDGTAHTVRWSIVAKTVAAGTTVTAAGTTVTFTGSSAARTVGVVVYDTATSTTLTPAAAGDVFRFTLRRIGADGADTYVGVVNLLGVIVSYVAG